MEEQNKKQVSVKERWLMKDEVCPNCGQVTKRVRGITKQNLKRLLVPKLNINEVTITLIIILVLFLAWAYKVETQACRNIINEMYNGTEEDCLAVCDFRCHAMNKGLQPGFSMPNLTTSNFTIK